MSLNTEVLMIGLVLVAHGRLADEFKAALEHVVGPQKQIEAITFCAEDDLIFVEATSSKRSTASIVATASPSSLTCSAARLPISRSPA